MAGTLLIIGLTLFFLGSLALAREASARGHSWVLLLVPFASARYVQNNWSDVWLAAMTRVLGVAMVLVAAGIAIARDPLVLEEPGRLFGVQARPEVAGSKLADMNSFVNSAEAIQIAIRNDENENLSGRIHGQDFLYDRVEVIDGILTARQGSGFLPDLELRILLDRDFTGLESREKIYVQPGESEPPVVHLSWKDQEGKLQTEIVRSGYQMELQLAPLTDHQLSGFLQIILPDARQSFLSGEFVAYTNRLRYMGDRVDLTYNHEDTLKYVAEQYLHTQYPEGAIKQVIFSNTRMRLSRDEGSTSATVTLASGRIERRDIPLERSDIGWAVRPSGVEITVVREGGEMIGALTEPEADKPDDGADEEPTEQPVEERQVEFSALADYLGLAVVTQRTDGKRQEGVLREVDDKRVVVEASLGGGTVRYQVKREELTRVEVPARHLVLLVEKPAAEVGAGMPETAPEPSPEAPAETATAPAAGTEASPGPAREEEAPPEEAAAAAPGPAELVGRTVRVTDNTGRTRTGLLKSVAEDGRVTLTVRMGAGSVDYYYRPGEIRSVEAAAE